MKITPELIARFRAKKIEIDATFAPLLGSPCWIWKAGRFDTGYGAFGVGNHVTTGAHRVAWAIARGPIPPGAWVLHRCDVRACVNPAHLFLGDATVNNRDAAAKGRSALGHPGKIQRLRGTAHPHAKLTPAKVRQIRALAARGEKQRTIAKRFGITQPSVGYIVRREQWRHVP